MSKIVIVEDDRPIREMYELKLKKAGYEVVTAEDGEAALQVITDFRPDLILLDLFIPKMTGDLVLEKIRETDWGKNIKVVVLTNLSADEAPDNLLSLGISRYIVKAHHTPSQVVDMVKEALK